MDPTEDSRLGTYMNIEEDYVAVISPESAIDVIKGTFSVTNKDGTKTPIYPMSGSTVYVLRDGIWKIVHLHFSWAE